MNITKFLYVLGVTFSIAGFAHGGQIVLKRISLKSKKENHDEYNKISVRFRCDI